MSAGVRHAAVVAERVRPGTPGVRAGWLLQHTGMHAVCLEVAHGPASPGKGGVSSPDRRECCCRRLGLAGVGSEEASPASVQLHGEQGLSWRGDGPVLRPLALRASVAVPRGTELIGRRMSRLFRLLVTWFDWICPHRISHAAVAEAAPRVVVKGSEQCTCLPPTPCLPRIIHWSVPRGTSRLVTALSKSVPGARVHFLPFLFPAHTPLHEPSSNCERWPRR